MPTYLLIIDHCFYKMLSKRQPTGSNKQLLPSLINVNVFSTGQTLYLENCSSINCLPWHCVGRVEVFREIQDILQDNRTGRAAGLCIRNFNIKEWEQPVFYLSSAKHRLQTFSNILTAGGGGGGLY